MSKPPAVNPRYVIYASAYGRTPDEQREFDKEAYPGGSCVGFSGFISKAWGLFAKDNNVPRSEVHLLPNDHTRFDEWLPHNASSIRAILDEERRLSREHWNKTATLKDKLSTVIYICGYDLEVEGRASFSLTAYNRNWEIPNGDYEHEVGGRRRYHIVIDGFLGTIRRLR